MSYVFNIFKFYHLFSILNFCTFLSYSGGKMNVYSGSSDKMNDHSFDKMNIHNGDEMNIYSGDEMNILQKTSYLFKYA